MEFEQFVDVAWLILGFIFGFSFIIAIITWNDDEAGDLYRSFSAMETTVLDKNVDLETLKSCVKKMLSLLNGFTPAGDDQRKDVVNYTSVLQAVMEMDNVAAIQIIVSSYRLPNWMFVYGDGGKKREFAKTHEFFKSIAWASLFTAAMFFLYTRGYSAALNQWLN
jgi:hypothetical protein